MRESTEHEAIERRPWLEGVGEREWALALRTRRGTGKSLPIVLSVRCAFADGLNSLDDMKLVESLPQPGNQRIQGWRQRGFDGLIQNGVDEEDHVGFAI